MPKIRSRGSGFEDEITAAPDEKSHLKSYLKRQRSCRAAGRAPHPDSYLRPTPRRVYSALFVLSAISALASLRHISFRYSSPFAAASSSAALWQAWRQAALTASNGEQQKQQQQPSNSDEKSICDMTSDELQQHANAYLPRIWQFWEGKQMPGYLSLCHELMVAMNPTIKVDVINGNCLKRVFPDTPTHFDYLIPAHKADYARCRILDRYGGMYNDLDTVTLNSLRPLFDKLDAGDHDIVRGLGGREYDTATTGNLGPMKPGLPGLRDCSGIWHEMMAEKVSKELGDQLIWTMNDDTILRPMNNVSRAEPDSIRYYDLVPFDSQSLDGSYIWYAFHDIIQNYRVAAYVRDGKFADNQFLVVLSNRNIPPQYKSYTWEEAYCSKSRISEMIRAQLVRAGRTAVVGNCSRVHMPNAMLELEFERVPSKRTTQLKFATNQAAVSGSMRKRNSAGK